MKASLEQGKDYSSLISGFCDDCSVRGMTGKSVEGYRSCLKMFLGFISRRRLSIGEVDNQSLKDFLAYLKGERKIKHKTTKTYFTALSGLYDYLIFEGLANANIIAPFRKRYLRRYKDDYEDSERKLISVEEMSRLINSIMDPRDRAIALILAKTGMRRGELLKLDVDDIKWEEGSIKLKPTPKRSNRVVFFDDECAYALKRWLAVREKLKPKTKALFVSYQGLNRLDRNAVYNAIVKYSKRLGFHDPNSGKLEDHFGPHCFRHWFTTWLRRNGMPREYIKELRGDARKEAIDIYDHIDREELRKAYLGYMPKLGI